MAEPKNPGPAGSSPEQAFSADWQALGKQSYRLVDDVLYMRLRGTVDVHELEEMNRIGLYLVQHYGYSIALINAHEVVSMSPEARRSNAEWRRQHPDQLGVTAIYGANAVARVLLSMLNRAATLLLLKPPRVHFVRDEAEGLAWIDEERLRLRILIQQAGSRSGS